MSVFNPKVALPALVSLALLGCAKEGDITSGGILATRSACPTVAIPAPTGDITLFNPETSRDASAIDVVGYLTNVRSTCDETGVPAYLEATSPNNRRLYERHGFEVTGVLQYGSSPPMWPMWRRPR